MKQVVLLVKARQLGTMGREIPGIYSRGRGERVRFRPRRDNSSFFTLISAVPLFPNLYGNSQQASARKEWNTMGSVTVPFSFVNPSTMLLFLTFVGFIILWLGGSIAADFFTD